MVFFSRSSGIESKPVQQKEMNKDSFVPDHVPMESTPLPLRRSLEWVQALPPSCSGLVCVILSQRRMKKLHCFLRPCPRHPIEAATATSIPLYPHSREKLLTAQDVYLFPLPHGNLFQRE